MSRWLAILLALGVPLLACNAILGVTDVKLEKRDSGTEEEEEEEEERRDSGQQVTEPPDDGRDKGALALGFLHACARLPDLSVKCWGDNGAGQLGDGIPFEAATRPANALEPQVVPGITDAVEIGAGLSHTCVIHNSSEMSCWGLNTFGQLGDGTVNRSSTPVKVKALTGAKAIAAGVSFTCALLNDKTVSCWGSNASGQIGDNTKGVDRPAPTAVPGLTGIAAIGAGNDHACAAGEDGSLSCWGKNDFGQLGIGSTTESLKPAKIASLTDVVQVVGAERFTCARQGSGKVFCWGDNDAGQLGTGSTSTTPVLAPAPVTGISDAQFLWVGFEHACVVKKDRSISCWGANTFGQLGNGQTSDSSPTPSKVTGAAAARMVYTGGDRSCSLSSNGKAFCWGANSVGQLGNGSKDRAFTAKQVLSFP